MRKRKFHFLAPLLLFLPLFSQGLPASAPAGQAKADSQLTVYFANWNVYTDPNHGQVKHLPWDQIDCIHHAFWKIVPQGENTFALAPADAYADTDAANPNAHFPQYKTCHQKYPQVDILLSVGGWTCSGYFSKMCATQSGRSSFIASCVEVLSAYNFFAGIDLDWEYPGVKRAGSGKDEGNPVVGDDKANYTLLLKELRAALDRQFGKGARRLTVCAAASTDILSHQDYAALHPLVDRINLMTYGMTDMTAKVTGHHSPLYGKVSADTAVKYLLQFGVPAGKIAIGSPLYSHGWKNVGMPAIGASGQGVKDATRVWNRLKVLEDAAVPMEQKGWHAGYDDATEAAYLWNDDHQSKDYHVFLTYESRRSLDAKIGYIKGQSLAGLIVWQSGGDDGGFSMLRHMYRSLHQGNG